MVTNEIVQGGEYTPTFYVPTPSFELNSKLRKGGIPSGAIIQLSSKTEGSGKTTLALQILKNAQQMGLNVGFVDAEMAMDAEWASNIGVDTSKWFFTQPTTGEKGFELAISMIKDFDCKLIVLDSIHALQPEYYHDADLGDSHIGNQAKLHTKALIQLLPILTEYNASIIAINQKRVNLTTMGARGYNSAGGKAWGFYSKLILELNRTSANSNKEKDVIDVDIFLEKNKLGPSFDTIKVKFKQGVGIMWEQDKLEELIASGDMVKSGAWYRYKDEPIAQGTDNALLWIHENYRS